ncbi:glycosyltransferase family 39 protein [Microtetraspora malaysiensis]|uniref:glycosyltransferase family 39 protein n=1 Tax=Microtetraspora malaysiensis TaxID=161358 RepID=UPI003D8D6E59
MATTPQITRTDREPPVPRFALRPVGAIALAATAVLLAVSPWYGYHRDELYFRLLGQRPRLGYFDTPPLTPLVARISTALFGDTVTALRIVPALLAGVLVVLVACVARELGGGRAAQIMAAAGVATGLFPLVAGHSLLTLTFDLPLWTAAILFILRALRRGDGRWWLAVGAAAGVAAYNRQLIVLLLVGVGAGILLAGPRTALRDPRLWLGALLALVIAAPNVVYQATHEWPQAQMAAALKIDEGDDNRITFVPLQLVLVSWPLVPVMVAGWIRLWRDRAVRSLAIAYPLCCAVVLYAGGRPDYVAGLLLLLFAAGCVPTVEWAAGRPRRRVLVTAAVALGVVSNVVFALPVIPAQSLRGTPVALANEVARESVGWPGFASQVAAVVRALPADDRARAILLAANYGEAGALDRWAGEYALPPVHSPHNELYWWGPPPETARVAVVVGAPSSFLTGRFARCDQVASVDGMAGEEQGVPITVCRDPATSWAALWPGLRHYS